MYTFLPIAPCTFSVNGKYYNLKVNEPFTVELKEAKIIASPSFRFRKYVRLITPLPKEEKSEINKTEVTKSSKIEQVSSISEEKVKVSFIEPTTESIPEPVKEESTNDTSLESEESTSTKRRGRRKSSSNE